MNWTFWTRSQPAAPDDCGTIDPLLSLYADGMASAEEVRRVEMHLPDCAACRASLVWMKATQRALASRPVVSPPADLRARIASAIAASSAAPASFQARPARAFALRPAFAAAASVAVLGVVSYSLLHTQTPHTAKSQPGVTPPVIVATVPPVSPAAPLVKPTEGLGVRPHLTPRAVSVPKRARFNPNLVARSQPDEITPEPVVKTHTGAQPDTKMLADAAPVMAPFKPHSSVVKKLILRTFHPNMTATNKSPVFSAETHKPPVVPPDTKNLETVVATASHTSTPSTPIFVEKPPVITPDPAPIVVATSNQEGRFQTAGLIRIPVGQIRSFTHSTIGMAGKSAAYASRTIKSDSSGTLPMVGETLH